MNAWAGPVSKETLHEARRFWRLCERAWGEFDREWPPLRRVSQQWSVVRQSQEDTRDPPSLYRMLTIAE